MKDLELAKRIQQTLLKITATADDIRRLCQECRDYEFQAVVVQPMWVNLAVRELEQSDIAVCSVADFPHGAGSQQAKAAETATLVSKGVDEIDVVCKIGYLRSGMDAAFREDLSAVVDAANGKITKVILETSILTDSELARAIDLAVEAGMDYIKTASGFNGPGATVEIIKKMHDLANGRIKIKAAGGIRTHDDALAILNAGADCIGTSSGVAIVTGSISSTTY
jgi:deoxyribose-phosphate aldolase